MRSMKAVWLPCFLQVHRRKKIVITPSPPEFPVSPRITVTVGQAQHTVVYGPYFSSQHEHGLFPYVCTAGLAFHHQQHNFYLASNSRIMNPLHRPKITGDGGTRTEYFATHAKANQKAGSAVMQRLLAKMCGDNLGDGAPELYGELEDLLKANRVCYFALICFLPAGSSSPPGYSCPPQLLSAPQLLSPPSGLLFSPPRLLPLPSSSPPPLRATLLPPSSCSSPPPGYLPPPGSSPPSPGSSSPHLLLLSAPSSSPTKLTITGHASCVYLPA